MTHAERTNESLFEVFALRCDSVARYVREGNNGLALKIEADRDLIVAEAQARGFTAAQLWAYWEA